MDSVENHYEVYTNDPRSRVIKLELVAAVKPLPGFVKGITTANIGYGDKAGSFNVWPAAQPVITVERGKAAAISLRLKPEGMRDATLRLPAGSPDMFKLRREATGAYWLDIAVAPINEPGAHAFPLKLDSSDGSSVTVKLTVNVPAENLIVTPLEVDMGELAISNARLGIAKSARVGIRKVVGALQIRSLSTTLAFLKLEQQTMVEGSSYLIRIRVDRDNVPKAGAYSGTVRIETGDSRMIEIPIKLVLSDR
jgi:hypothetical protein